MKTRKNLFVIIAFIIIFSNGAFFVLKAEDTKISIPLIQNEKVWAGVVFDGYLMPLAPGYQMNYLDDNKRNQTQPLLLSTHGLYVWSETPYAFEIKDNEIVITKILGDISYERKGNTLREAVQHVSKTYFPPTGDIPDELLFTSPQYNTWIELNFNQNEEDILNYAQAIIENGLPPGVIMIDDTWQEDYGVWDFHPGRFKNPKRMVEKLHAMGFKVMLWICPMVSADQSVLYRHLAEKKALLMEKINPNDTYETAEEPIMIRWWNGVSAEIDFSSPTGFKWFNEQLERLVHDYQVDGFKFDAADSYFYPENSLSYGGISSNEQSEIYARIGLNYPLNEFRACWKMGGEALVQRLHDKGHNWEDLQQLIPNMLTAGLIGYPYSCPDMIGGGMLGTFWELNDNLNQTLVVRSAQCHALMPMMQFSVAPWRVLDKEHLDATLKSVNYREQFMPRIMELVYQASQTGEPIVRPMEYVFPHQNLTNIVDQFMLGDEVLVAPVLSENNYREIVLPKGSFWRSDEGRVYKGGQTIKENVPLDRLPYFLRQKGRVR